MYIRMTTAEDGEEVHLLHHDESATHLVRRLEAFSDIVIAFSLAQLSLGMVIPQKFPIFLENPLWFIAYAWTFALVCQMWVSHHKLFVRAFIPSRTAIFLNFVWLASVGLIIYLIQVWIHFSDELFATRWIFEAYFGLFAINIAILARLYYLGIRRQNGRFDAETLQFARRNGARLAIASAVILAIVLVGPLVSARAFFWLLPPSPGYGFFIAGVAQRLAKRYSPKTLSGQDAAGPIPDVALMEDQSIHAHIESLVAEEHRLLEHGDGGHLDPIDRQRLDDIQVQLDRYYDLLRQRRARRDAGQDPEVAHMRSADTVENYRQ